MWVDLRGDEQVACLAAVLAKTALALEAQATAVHGAGRDLHGERVRFVPCLGMRTVTRFSAPLNASSNDTFSVTFMSWPLRARGWRAPPPKPPNVAEVPVRCRTRLRRGGCFPECRTSCRSRRLRTPPKMSSTFTEPPAAAPSVRNLVFVRRAVLVVELALLVVAQNLVGLVELLEFRLVAARIGVMLARQLAERLLYLVRLWRYGERPAFCSSPESPPCSPPIFLYVSISKGGPTMKARLPSVSYGIRPRSSWPRFPSESFVRKAPRWAARAGPGPPERPNAAVRTRLARPRLLRIRGLFGRLGPPVVTVTMAGRKHLRSQTCSPSGTPRQPSRRARWRRPPWPRPAPQGRRTPRLSGR